MLVPPPVRMIDAVIATSAGFFATYFAASLVAGRARFEAFEEAFTATLRIFFAFFATLMLPSVRDAPRCRSATINIVLRARFRVCG